MTNLGAARLNQPQSHLKINEQMRPRNRRVRASWPVGRTVQANRSTATPLAALTWAILKPPNVVERRLYLVQMPVRYACIAWGRLGLPGNLECRTRPEVA